MDTRVMVDRRIHGLRIRAECSRKHAAAAGHVLDAFENLSASGVRICAGSQIRFGWSLLRLFEDGEGLRIKEPDFGRWPQQFWTETIDVTIEVLGAQTNLLRNLRLDGEDACFDQKIIAARDAISQPAVFLKRGSAASSDDSGWLLGAVDDPEALSHGPLEAVLIANLVDRRPALLQALTLPVGFIAIFAGPVLEQVIDAGGTARLEPQGRTP